MFTSSQHTRHIPLSQATQDCAYLKRRRQPDRTKWICDAREMPNENDDASVQCTRIIYTLRCARARACGICAPKSPSKLSARAPHKFGAPQDLYVCLAMRVAVKNNERPRDMGATIGDGPETANAFIIIYVQSFMYYQVNPKVGN